MPEIARLSSAQSDFGERLAALTAFESTVDGEVGRRVGEILADVRAHGDDAVVRYTEKYDGVGATRVSDLELPRAALKGALAGLERTQRDALTLASSRIR